MKLTKYNNYKNTNIHWLGDIPEHWEVKRIKDISELRSGDNFTANEFEENGIYSVFGGNGFRGKTNRFTNDGDYILIGRQGALCGNINYAHGKFWATEHAVVVYISKKTNMKWYGEMLRVMNLNQYSLASAQPGLSVEKIKRLSFPTPPLSEQTAIANYLDQKTTQIDKKIELLTQKIEKYKELKKSLINETVCRGLDKNVKLKPSGIDWIGDIPEHWEVKRLKDIGFLYSGLSGKSANDFNQEDNINNKGFITFVNIANNQYIKKDSLGSVVILENDNQNQVNKSDLFFLMSSESYADIGKSSLLLEDIEDTYLNSFCKGFRVTNKLIKPVFLNYLMSASSFRDNLIVQGKGFTRINLKIEKINDFKFVIPSYKEQTAIAEYLDAKTNKINQITANLSQQIEALKELRKTLINEVVTGKVRVID